MNQQTFKHMPKKQKENFLSNDLAERIIGVEQKVSARFGNFVPYRETKYYQSFTLQQRERFEKYLKSKKRKKIFVYFIFLLPLIILSLMNINFTGNVVKENYGNHVFLNFTLLVFVLVSVFILIFYSLYNRFKKAKFENHFKIVENIYFRK